WIKVFEIAKQYGINHYRFHTCCPPEAAFRAADLMGIYLEPELPFWGTITTSEDENHNETAQQYLIQEGFRILDEFGNHPSFMFMSLGNELWGNREKLNEILGLYKDYDKRHLYTQGSNNFQFMPAVLENDDFFCGVRFSKDRLIRGSYAMCDAPLGQIQMKRPGSQHNYDAFICQAEASFREEVSDTKEIQYGTGMKTVKMDIANELICKVPVVTHEIGQYAMYPHFSEIEKYTGVLKPKNIEKLKMVLQEKKLFKMAESFFRSSGLLSVDCYKAELETALASNELSGFQILDLQDFPGQGMAFVGILDSLMESKGLITPEEWRSFCSSRVLLARLPKFVFTSLEEVTIGIKYSQFYPTNLINPRIQIQIEDNQGVIFHEVVEAKGTYGNGVHALGEITVKFPEIKNPQKLILTVSMVNTTVANHYDLWLFPNNQKMVISDDIVITEDFTKMWDAIRSGKKVLFYPDNLNEKNSIEGTYCTDFWCYPMFRSISESMGKPVPVGTCGLMIDEQSPVFRYFPTKEYTTPQWYEVITKSRPLILDHYQVEPLVWMIDNFERNHKLGLLLEMKVGEGKLFISACNLSRIKDDCCSKWLEYSILNYMESEEFLPLTETSQEELLALFGN
ncbi:MAG: beta-glucuronidase, partial [Clostridiales bacterium]|nr:beta-glucuronidase [Clostridiales bacterium]